MSIADHVCPASHIELASTAARRLFSSWLSFYPRTCLYLAKAKSAQSFSVGKTSLLLLGEATTYQFSPGGWGWVRVTRLSPATGTIRGQLDLSLHDHKEKIAILKKADSGVPLLSP